MHRLFYNQLVGWALKTGAARRLAHQSDNTGTASLNTSMVIMDSHPIILSTVHVFTSSRLLADILLVRLVKAKQTT